MMCYPPKQTGIVGWERIQPATSLRAQQPFNTSRWVARPAWHQVNTTAATTRYWDASPQYWRRRDGQCHPFLPQKTQPACAFPYLTSFVSEAGKAASKALSSLCMPDDISPALGNESRPPPKDLTDRNRRHQPVSRPVLLGPTTNPLQSPHQETLEPIQARQVPSCQGFQQPLSKLTGVPIVDSYRLLSHRPPICNLSSWVWSFILLATN